MIVKEMRQTTIGARRRHASGSVIPAAAAA